jgi:DNA uptake protein ComE-like DNA-binding protein
MHFLNAIPRIRSNRSRRRAMTMLGGMAIGFLAMNQLAIYRSTQTQDRIDVPPHFAIDLDSASQAELRLLPSVGAKTAQNWETARSQPTYSKPQSQADLEKLPQVGPKRAQQLAPHLLETNR